MEKTATKRFEVRIGESKMLKTYCPQCNDITSHEIRFKKLDGETVHYESLYNLCVIRAHLKYEKEPVPTAETLTKKEFCFLWDVKLYDD